MMPGGWWSMGWMWIWWVILILLMVALVFWAASASRRSGTHLAPPSPEEILKRRYASGEISKQEYEEKLAGLRR